MKKQKLVVVDDHEMFRAGLVFILKDFENIEVIGEASNGKELLKIASEELIDIVLMDINMPEMDGIEATREIIKVYPKVKVIALSMHGEEEYYDKMVEAGVKGFLLKNSGVDDLKLAINAIINGDTFFSQELLVSIINKKKNVHDPEETVHLTNRELEVLELICEGYCNNDIAEKLYISQRTVDRHRANLLSKTNCKNSISLVMYAIKHKIINI